MSDSDNRVYSVFNSSTSGVDDKDSDTMGMYSVFDRVAKEFFPPFVSKNDDTAERVFKNSIKGDMVPSDYILYYVGRWDSVYGAITPETIAIIIDGEEVDKCSMKK